MWAIVVGVSFFCLLRVDLGAMALLDSVVDNRTTGEGRDSGDVVRSSELPSWRSSIPISSEFSCSFCEVNSLVRDFCCSAVAAPSRFTFFFGRLASNSLHLTLIGKFVG